MKKEIILSVLCFFVFKVHAQSGGAKYLQDYDNKKFHWGYTLGLNQFGFKFDQTPAFGTSGHDVIRFKEKMGFHVGIMGGLRFSKYVTLRFEPTVYFATRQVIFTQLEDETREVKSNYVDLPLLIKLNSIRYRNIRPYVSVGGAYDINMTSDETSREDNYSGIFRTTTGNFNWQSEFGVEIYTRLFKLTPAVKGIFFLTNEKVPDNIEPSNYTDPIDRISSQAIVFSLKFE